MAAAKCVRCKSRITVGKPCKRCERQSLTLDRPSDLSHHVKDQIYQVFTFVKPEDLPKEEQP